MPNIIRLPDPHQDFHDARRVIRSQFSTWEDVDAALEVLDHSREWADIDLCQKTRDAKRLHAPKPAPRNTVTPAQFDLIMRRAPVRGKPRLELSPLMWPLVILAGLWAFVLITEARDEYLHNYRLIYGEPE